MDLHRLEARYSRAFGLQAPAVVYHQPLVVFLQPLRVLPPPSAIFQVFSAVPHACVAVPVTQKAAEHAPPATSLLGTRAPIRPLPRAWA